MAILELKDEKVNVFPFSDEYNAVQDVPIATVATVWENPKNRELWMLVFHEALYFGSKLKESLLCPNQMRAAGVKIDEAPIQFNPSSTHSLPVGRDLVIPLEMHGVISYLNTRLPTDAEIAQYRAGHFQSVELTKDFAWEPYSEEFAEREVAARTATRPVSSTKVTYPRPNPATQLAVEEEEEEEETEEENFGTELPVSPRSPWDLMNEARCIAVASRWAQSREVLELDDEEETLATCLIAAMNVSSMDINGGGLDERSKDCLITMTNENRAIAAMSTQEQGPIISKEILAKRWGIGLDTAHQALTATTQQGIQRVLHPME